MFNAGNEPDVRSGLFPTTRDRRGEERSPSSEGHKEAAPLHTLSPTSCARLLILPDFEIWGPENNGERMRTGLPAAAPDLSLPRPGCPGALNLCPSPPQSSCSKDALSFQCFFHPKERHLAFLNFLCVGISGACSPSTTTSFLLNRPWCFCVCAVCCTTCGICRPPHELGMSPSLCLSLSLSLCP